MKKILAVTICFMFVGVGSSFAELLQMHSFELVPEISHITYEEPGIMEEKGIMYGIDVSYTYHNKLMLKAEGKVSAGQVDFDGRLFDGTPLTIDNINDFILEFRGLGGYDFISESLIFTPYIGFGYRYLYDNLSVSLSGYERESNYYYSPIGIETITDLENGWFLGVILEYDLFWRGKQKSYLTDVFCSNDVENDQDGGYGFRGSIRFQKKGERVGFAIEPFIRYWDIEDSDISLTTCPVVGNISIREPDNNSTEIGVKIVIVF